jgi:divalent metal cation (Fe/Co/Zn/Cd) transporter
VPVLLDVAALAGLVIAAVGIGVSHALRAPTADAIASILDGVLLMATAGILMWEAHGLIVGEAARTPLLDDARRIIRSEAHIAALDELRSLQLGPEAVLLVLRARFADGVDAAEVARIGHALEARLREEHPSIQQVVFDFN